MLAIFFGACFYIDLYVSKVLSLFSQHAVTVYSGHSYTQILYNNIQPNADSLTTTGYDLINKLNKIDKQISHGIAMYKCAIYRGSLVFYVRRTYLFQDKSQIRIHFRVGNVFGLRGMFP